MRLSSAFAIFCLAASASPSLAIPTILSERVDTRAVAEPTPHSTSKAVVGGVTGTMFSLGIATVINTLAAWLQTNHTKRGVLESLDTRINEELDARAHHRRVLLTRLLDNLD